MVCVRQMRVVQIVYAYQSPCVQVNERPEIRGETDPEYLDVGRIYLRNVHYSLYSESPHRIIQPRHSPLQVSRRTVKMRKRYIRSG